MANKIQTAKSPPVKSTSKIKPGNLLGKHFYCDRIDSAVEVIDEKLIKFGNEQFFSAAGVLVKRWDNSQQLLMDVSELEEIESFWEPING